VKKGVPRREAGPYDEELQLLGLKKKEWTQLNRPAFKEAVGVPEDEEDLEAQVEREEGVDAQGHGGRPDVEEYPLLEGGVAIIRPLSRRGFPS
jgi:hypothetical protein